MVLSFGEEVAVIERAIELEEKENYNILTPGNEAEASRTESSLLRWARTIPEEWCPRLSSVHYLLPSSAGPADNAPQMGANWLHRTHK